MHPIKAQQPNRNCDKEYQNYRRYKPFLSEDFNDRCGYCDTPSQRIGGVGSMHIDHFVPWKKFKELHEYLYTDYNNLVFACPYCNSSKSDDWPTNDPLIHNKDGVGYVDPCDDEYSRIFTRTRNGIIVPLTPVAKYMHEKLSLGLRRHKIIWQLEKLYKLFHEIDELIINPNLNTSIREELINYRDNISVRYMRIERQFREILA